MRGPSSAGSVFAVGRAAYEPRRVRSESSSHPPAARHHPPTARRIHQNLAKCSAGLERNDFSHWPYGIYARAYVRQYAKAIGVDPDTTVDEFCRWFPQGDRRVEKVVKEHAEIVGHTDLAWKDDVAPHGDRRPPRRHRRAATRRQESRAVRFALPPPRTSPAPVFGARRRMPRSTPACRTPQRHRFTQTHECRRSAGYARRVRLADLVATSRAVARVAGPAEEDRPARLTAPSRPAGRARTSSSRF